MRFLFFIVLPLAIVLRLLPVLYHGYDPSLIKTEDSSVYLDLAQNLKNGFELKRSTAGSVIDNPWEYEIFRTPGYPALIYFLGSSFKLIIIFQIFLSSLIVLITFFCGRSLFNETVAKIASFLIAIDIPHIVNSNLIMSDILFVFLISTSIFILVSPKKATKKSLFFSGLSLTLASSVRPISFFLCILYTIFLQRKKISAKKICLFLAVSLAFPTFWLTRNYILIGKITPSNSFEYNLSFVFAAKVKSDATGVPRGIVGKEIAEKAVNKLTSNGYWDTENWFNIVSSIGYSTIKDYYLYIPISVTKLAGQMLFSGERRHLLQILNIKNSSNISISEGASSSKDIYNYLSKMSITESIPFLYQVAINLLIFALFLIGSILAIFKNNEKADRDKTLFLVFCVLYFIALSIIVGSARMRIPFSMVYLIVAGTGLQRVIQNYHGGVVSNMSSTVRAKVFKNSYR